MTGFTSHKQILGCLLLALCCTWILPATLRAQGAPVRAWVSSVERDAQLSRAGRGPFAIRRGEQLEADDVITTGAGASVVIALSDGSQVVVFANSSVTLKNFRTPHSMRELLDITLGRVRVKIRHLGKQPNPYRVNSPAASIAVRGTGFLVDVQPGGETRVAVSEGLVEVASLADPSEKRLVAAGQQVIVAMRGRIGMALPGPGSEINGRARLASNPVQDLAAAYQRSVEAVAQNSIETQPALFAAFADAHLDSLENPAYAADFRQAQGRLLLLPSIRRTDRLVVTSGGVPVQGFPINGHPHRFDYTFTPQFTFFAPVPNSRFTLGGGITAVRTSLHALTLYEAPEENWLNWRASSKPMGARRISPPSMARSSRRATLAAMAAPASAFRSNNSPATDRFSTWSEALEQLAWLGATLNRRPSWSARARPQAFHTSSRTARGWAFSTGMALLRWISGIGCEAPAGTNCFPLTTRMFRPKRRRSAHAGALPSRAGSFMAWRLPICGSRSRAGNPMPQASSSTSTTGRGACGLAGEWAWCFGEIRSSPLIFRAAITARQSPRPSELGRLVRICDFGANAAISIPRTQPSRAISAAARSLPLRFSLRLERAVSKLRIYWRSRRS